MSKPYSDDLRRRVVSSVIEGGVSRRQAAERYDLGRAFVHEEKLSYKKRRWSRPNADGRMSRAAAISG